MKLHVILIAAIVFFLPLWKSEALQGYSDENTGVAGPEESDIFCESEFLKTKSGYSFRLPSDAWRVIDGIIPEELKEKLESLDLFVNIFEHDCIVGTALVIVTDNALGHIQDTRSLIPFGASLLDSMTDDLKLESSREIVIGSRKGIEYLYRSGGKDRGVLTFLATGRAALLSSFRCDERSFSSEVQLWKKALSSLQEIPSGCSRGEIVLTEGKSYIDPVHGFKIKNLPGRAEGWILAGQEKNLFQGGFTEPGTLLLVKADTGGTMIFQGTVRPLFLLPVWEMQKLLFLQNLENACWVSPSRAVSCGAFEGYEQEFIVPNSEVSKTVLVPTEKHLVFITVSFQASALQRHSEEAERFVHSFRFD